MVWTNMRNCCMKCTRDTQWRMMLERVLSRVTWRSQTRLHVTVWPCGGHEAAKDGYWYWNKWKWNQIPGLSWPHPKCSVAIRSWWSAERQNISIHTESSITQHCSERMQQNQAIVGNQFTREELETRHAERRGPWETTAHTEEMAKQAQRQDRIQCEHKSRHTHMHSHWSMQPSHLQESLLCA